MATSAIAFLPGGTGFADPPPALAQVQAQAADLDLQADQAIEDYQQAQVTLDGLRVRAVAATAEVARQRQVVAALQAQVGDVVAAAYRNGTAGASLSLLTHSSSPQNYLDRATSLDQLAAEQSDRLAEVTAARTRLDAADRQARGDLAAQQAVAEQAAAHKQAVEADLAASQALLNSLQASQRTQLLAAQAGDLAAAPSTAAAPTYAGPATGAAAVAVQGAYAELGRTYVWGASGPSTFDCSGLTMFVWAKAGVALPHSSRTQYSVTRHVPQSDIQPGDLVFYGSPIHHVGIYIGGGNMISAPHTGAVVDIEPAFRGDYVGASRP